MCVNIDLGTNVEHKFSVVTTFNQSGYDKYGSRMIDTFLKNWPSSVALYVYAEDCTVTQQADNLTIYNFNQQVPALVAFKEKWKDDPRATGNLATGPADRKGRRPGIGFRWDAIRFSHKVYAVCDIARRLEHTLFWMDADMVCHTPIDISDIEKLTPVDHGIAFLGRKRKFTECGLYALNMSQPATQAFVELFQWQYDNAEQGIFTMKEWNDCWVFDRTREKIQSKFPEWRQLNWSEGIIDGEGHPLINSEWGKYLDHLKGNRKDLGRSKDGDLVRPRNEDYWR